MRLLNFIICIALSMPAVASKFSVGTGFFYNSTGDLFTNKHVVSGCLPSSIRVRTNDHNWHNARILAIDSNADLAALSIDQKVEAFASFRIFADTNNVSVPEKVEDVFSAGYSSPAENNYKLQYKWGQIQPWNDPNVRPYVNRMRMNAFAGASGSPILDYAGLLVGILFAGSIDPAPDYENLRPAGYGDKWIYVYNGNALLQFANDNRLNYNAWGRWERKDPMFIVKHASRITTLIVCKL